MLVCQRVLRYAAGLLRVHSASLEGKRYKAG